MLLPRPCLSTAFVPGLMMWMADSQVHNRRTLQQARATDGENNGLTDLRDT